MTLYEKVLVLMRPENYQRLDAEDKKKMDEIADGCAGYGEDITDYEFKNNCLSPHWSVDSQVNFINKKYNSFK